VIEGVLLELRVGVESIGGVTAGHSGNARGEIGWTFPGLVNVSKDKKAITS
jgi:hypothetical protein